MTSLHNHRKHVDFLKKAMGLPMGRDLEGNRNKLHCKMGAVCEERYGGFTGSCLFKRIIFCWQKMYFFKKKLFNFLSLYIDETLVLSPAVKVTVFAALW